MNEPQPKYNQIKPGKKNPVKALVKQDEDLHVYEGEIIYQDREPAAVEKKFAYKLGKLVGSALSVLGGIAEMGQPFKGEHPGPGEGNERTGRRMRRFRRRRQK